MYVFNRLFDYHTLTEQKTLVLMLQIITRSCKRQVPTKSFNDETIDLLKTLIY